MKKAEEKKTAAEEQQEKHSPSMYKTNSACENVLYRMPDSTDPNLHVREEHTFDALNEGGEKRAVEVEKHFRYGQCLIPGKPWDKKKKKQGQKALWLNFNLYGFSASDFGKDQVVRVEVKEKSLGDGSKRSFIFLDVTKSPAGTTATDNMAIILDPDSREVEVCFSKLKK